MLTTLSDILKVIENLSPVLIPVAIMSGLGLIAGMGLAVASYFLAVPSDERAEKVLERLPGINCGACGYSGCGEYAKAVAEGEAEVNLCVPGGDKTAEEIAKVMGVDAKDVIEEIALVHCAGTCDKTNARMEYKGIKTCESASMHYKGTGVCQYSCVGFGDCVGKCPYGAISIRDGIAVIDEELCTGCGLCVPACPKGIIGMIPDKHTALVRCSSKDSGAVTRKACSIGCIGCKKCEKVCPEDAIHIVDNLFTIDYDKCTACGECVKVCPVDCIILR